ncbi:MAG TPA: hypothetical protein VFP49_03720 [Nitrososphaeraceae archaeon]|nr:hypothetical protein [Nitrososphaeraceae archaeon]
MASNNNNQNKINPRPCIYNCGIQIYWNASVNEYWEVFTKKKHICPNRGNKSSGTTTTTITKDAGITPPSTAQKPRYFNPSARKRIPYASFANQQQSKPKMSNSFEYLQGSITEIQKKYEILSDIVTEYGGKVHGSQRDRDPKTGLIDLLVYYEVPEGKREEVKRKFDNVVLFSTSSNSRN